MSTDNDQATVDRLCLLTYTSDQEGEPHDCVECADAARAILDAIRKGEVPGVITDDMVKTTKLLVYESALDEIAGLRADLARSRQHEAVCHCGALLSEHTQSENHGAVPMDRPCPNAERADKATADRDRLEGMLCDAGICLLSKDEGRQVSMAAQIDAALAEVGKS